jgi:hypothetical protein
VGTHTASFSLFAVASYTMRISSSPLGTVKYLMFDFTNESEGMRYLCLSTFKIFSLVFARILTSLMIGCFFRVVGPGRSKKTLTPSLASLRYRSGKRK